MKRILALGCLMAIVALGCRPAQQPYKPRAYFGPTEPLATVVQQINANNQKIKTLYANGYFDAEIGDGKGHADPFNANARLLYRKPQEFRLVGRKEIGNVEIATNAQNYWVIVKPKISTMWWGSYASLDRVHTKEIPIRPDLMLEVLGVNDIDTNFKQQPAPVMVFNNDADSYMIRWQVTAPDRWIAQKEVWYDRKTYLPTHVLLFDENGRIVLSAYLSQHQKVRTDDVPEDQWPKVATNYRLFFPDTQSRIALKLNEVESSHAGAPNEYSFQFPGDKAGVEKIISVDEQPGQ
jgi:outer membrane lipoprotein-sorting protein